MAGPSLRLVDVSISAAGAEIEHEIAVLRPEEAGGDDPIFCQQFDLGAPTARESTQERANVSGSIDLTRFYGPRTFTADLTLKDTAFVTKEETLDKLTAASHPAKRPWIYVKRRHWTEEWRMQVRPNPFSMISNRASASAFKCSLSYVCPSGALESTVTHQSIIRPGVGGTGIALPVSWQSDTDYPPAGGVFFNAGTSVATTDAYNEGNTETPARFRIYGRCKNPSIINFTTGERITLKDVVIESGQVLDIDVESKSVLMNYDLKQSYYGRMDWSVSTWFYLTEGTNIIAFQATEADAGAMLSIDWRARRL